MSKFWHVMGHVAIIGLGIAAHILIPGIPVPTALAVQGIAQTILGIVNHGNGAAASPQGSSSNPAGVH